MTREYPELIDSQFHLFRDTGKLILSCARHGAEWGEQLACILYFWFSCQLFCVFCRWLNSIPWANLNSRSGSAIKSGRSLAVWFVCNWTIIWQQNPGILMESHPKYIASIVLTLICRSPSVAMRAVRSLRALHESDGDASQGLSFVVVPWRTTIHLGFRQKNHEW